MGFPRQEYWSMLPFSSLGDLPNLGIEPGSPELQADPLWSESPEIPHLNYYDNYKNCERFLDTLCMIK